MYEESEWEDHKASCQRSIEALVEALALELSSKRCGLHSRQGTDRFRFGNLFVKQQGLTNTTFRPANRLEAFRGCISGARHRCVRRGHDESAAQSMGPNQFPSHRAVVCNLRTLCSEYHAVVHRLPSGRSDLTVMLVMAECVYRALRFVVHHPHQRSIIQMYRAHGAAIRETQRTSSPCPATLCSAKVCPVAPGILRRMPGAHTSHQRGHAPRR